MLENDKPVDNDSCSICNKFEFELHNVVVLDIEETQANDKQRVLQSQGNSLVSRARFIAIAC
jgi:hypothetical protein